MFEHRIRCCPQLRAKLLVLLVSSVAGVFCATEANAQSDTVTIIPDARYEAGSFHRWLFGDDYRDLWTMPIRVPVLDLDTVAGGLTVIDIGGGLQTRSLQLMGGNGREYRFRSVQKFPARAAHPDLAGALAGRLLQDQVSSSLPGAPVAAARIAIAAGLPHPLPNLYVLPDDASLGEYREQFAGMLGTFEEFPDEAEDGGAGFQGFTRIAGTESFLENIQEGTEHRVDSRRFLSARLTDLILGDWDRHFGQWRWARHDVDGAYLWTPIPRDRDYAFVEYDGAALSLVRQMAPNATRFTAGYADLEGLILNASDVDRRMLSDLDRATWDSVTVALQREITDEEIDEALSHLPPEFISARGDHLRSTLRSRRDMLREASTEYYEKLARVPEIYTTDEAEEAVVTRFPEGDVEVLVLTPEGDTYFRRRFLPTESHEIRLYLQGGDDKALVRGSARRGIRLRVIGGKGDDLLADSSQVTRLGHWTSFHDGEGDNAFVLGPSTGADRRPYTERVIDLNAIVPIPPASSGSDLSIQPLVDYSTTRGGIAGVRLESTRYGFRRERFASHLQLDGRVSTKWKDVGFRLAGALQSTIPSLLAEGELIASRIDASRFYGFGNETTRALPSELYVVRQELLQGFAGVRYRLSPISHVSGGAVARHSRPWVPAGSPLDQLDPLGSNGFSAFGLRAGVDVDRPMDGPAAGFHANLLASVYPVVSDQSSYYADTRSEVGFKLPISSSGRTTLGARLGGQYVWGNYPFFGAAYLGGRETLRGLPEDRFAGDGMAYGGAEASTYVGRLRVVANWAVSAFVFADAGRVFYEGEESNVWHTAPGVGLSFTALELLARISYAQGPEPRLYFETSAPF